MWPARSCRGWTVTLSNTPISKSKTLTCTVSQPTVSWELIARRAPQSGTPPPSIPSGSGFRSREARTVRLDLRSEHRATPCGGGPFGVRRSSPRLPRRVNLTRTGFQGDHLRSCLGQLISRPDLRGSIRRSGAAPACVHRLVARGIRARLALRPQPGDVLGSGRSGATWRADVEPRANLAV